MNSNVHIKIKETIDHLSYSTRDKYDKYYDKICADVASKIEYKRNNVITVNNNYLITTKGKIKYQSVIDFSRIDKKNGCIRFLKNITMENKYFDFVEQAKKLFKKDYDDYLTELNNITSEDITNIGKYVKRYHVNFVIGIVIICLTCDLNKEKYNELYNLYHLQDCLDGQIMDIEINRITFTLFVLTDTNLLNNLTDSVSNKIVIHNMCFTKLEPIEDDIFWDKDRIMDLLDEPLGHATLLIIENKNIYMYDPDEYTVTKKLTKIIKLFNNADKINLLYYEDPIQARMDNYIDGCDIFCMFHCIRFINLLYEYIDLDKNVSENINKEIISNIDNILMDTTYDEMIKWITSFIILLDK